MAAAQSAHGAAAAAAVPGAAMCCTPVPFNPLPMETTMPNAPTALNHRDLDLVLPLESSAPSDGDTRALLHEQVAQAAYRIAEARGFTPGAELDDWLTAEQGLHSLHPVSLPA